MSARHPLDDDTLSALVARVLDADDPVPADALALALAARELAGADDELAELVFDSLLDEPAVGVRGAEPGVGVADADVRSLSFSSGHLAIEVDLAADGTGLVGRVEPADPTIRVVLRQPGGDDVHTEADELGRFRFALRPGPLRLRLSGPTAGITTPWITR